MSDCTSIGAARNQKLRCWKRIRLADSSRSVVVFIHTCHRTCASEDTLCQICHHSFLRRALLSSCDFIYSGENKRTIGRPKMNQLINWLMNLWINSWINQSKEEDSQLWFVENKLHTALRGQSTHENLIKKSGLRRTLSDKSCLRRIFCHKRSCLRHIFFIQILLLNHSGMHFIFCFFLNVRVCIKD